ncbi:MAG: DUF1801 domain-containing protein [Deltaproteobacteria bacterium]|nr:DUF1801 domain-containing protein [Deltaproteobacteria bacterium]
MAYTAKTRPTATDVDAFLASLKDEGRRKDSVALLALLREVTGQEPKLWGEGMVGFGAYHYRYASGHEGDSFVLGFAPRKAALTLYVMAGFERMADLLGKLGPHKLGKGCLYLKRLGDADPTTLRALLTRAAAAPPPSAADTV